MKRSPWPSVPTWVFFDGPCATCHAFVRFLLARSRAHRFRFAPLEDLRGTAWETAIAVTLGHGLEDSVVVWRNGELLSRARAVFAILGELGWPWVALVALQALPVALLDAGYAVVARHRHRTGDLDAFCRLRSPDEQALFQPPPMDAPTFAPRPRVFLGAQWQYLVVQNYEVPASLLQPCLPKGTSLDPWDGTHLVSLVAFSFTRTSVRRILLPWCADFEEVNLRFYVRRCMPDGTVRRGVVFVREVVPHAITAFVARVFYNERYVARRMGHRIDAHAPADPGTGPGAVHYEWIDGERRFGIEARIAGPPALPAPGSLPHFLLEHYYGYAVARDGGTTEYEVEHPAWRVWLPESVRVTGQFGDFYPPAFAPWLRTPHSTIVAEGSAVRVFRGTRIA